jgi:restriction system protein
MINENIVDEKIPSFTEFFNPVLEFLKNQTDLVHRSDIIDGVIKKLSPDPALLDKNTKQGDSVYKNRIAWALSFLNLTDHISNDKKRGYYEITNLGISNYPVEEKEILQLERINHKKWKEQKERKSKQQMDDKDIPDNDYKEAINIDKDEDWKDKVLSVLVRLKSESFEKFCGQFLRHIGFENVQVTQRTRDGGFDATAIFKQSILSTKVLIECKKWDEKNNVGDEVVHKLRGVMKTHHVDRGVIFTTSDFTKSAYETARSVGDIDLICGDDICNLMKKHEFGVKVEMKPVIIVDEDFIFKFDI